MSLLFDQNLSHRLVQLLAGEYPSSAHVRDVALAAADDQAIWDYAARHNLMVVSKDADFQHRALLYGHPPKVIWLRIGNGPTSSAETILRTRLADVRSFAGDPQVAFLVLP